MRLDAVAGHQWDNHIMVFSRPRDQRWFWTARWQQREREVDAHVAVGVVYVHVDGDALLGHLDSLDVDTPLPHGITSL
ncbi:hypothetical protein ACXPWS_15270 [Mycobacterium sp. BMJ-28]